VPLNSKQKPLGEMMVYDRVRAGRRRKKKERDVNHCKAAALSDGYQEKREKKGKRSLERTEKDKRYSLGI